MRARELTCVCFLLTSDRGAVPIEELSENERDAWRESARRRLSAELSAYYTQHPEQYERL
jgi:hypothetical protein